MPFIMMRKCSISGIKCRAINNTQSHLIGKCFAHGTSKFLVIGEDGTDDNLALRSMVTIVEVPHPECTKVGEDCVFEFSSTKFLKMT